MATGWLTVTFTWSEPKDARGLQLPTAVSVFAVKVTIPEKRAGGV